MMTHRQAELIASFCLFKADGDLQQAIAVMHKLLAHKPPADYPQIEAAMHRIIAAWQAEPRPIDFEAWQKTYRAQRGPLQ